MEERSYEHRSHGPERSDRRRSTAVQTHPEEPSAPLFDRNTLMVIGLGGACIGAFYLLYRENQKVKSAIQQLQSDKSTMFSDNWKQKIDTNTGAIVNVDRKIDELIMLLQAQAVQQQAAVQQYSSQNQQIQQNQQTRDFRINGHHEHEHHDKDVEQDLEEQDLEEQGPDPELIKQKQIKQQQDKKRKDKRSKRKEIVVDEDEDYLEHFQPSTGLDNTILVE